LDINTGDELPPNLFAGTESEDDFYDESSHDEKEQQKPPVPAPKTHELAAALVRLRGETQGAISLATQIKTTNLSVWLRQGKEQVISKGRIGELMHYLGVSSSYLRDDMLHQWTIGEKARGEDLGLVFGAALEPCGIRWMFEDRQSQPPMTRILMAGKAIIGVSLYPALSKTPDLAEAFKPERVVKVDDPLSDLVKQNLDTVRIKLLELSENALLFDPLSESSTVLNQFSIQAKQDLEPLRIALRLAFSTGATPMDVARVIEGHFSGNADG